MEQPPSASLPRSCHINREGSEVRPEVLPGVRFHNTDYVKELRPSFEPPASPGPVGASAGKEFRSRAIPGPGAKLRTLRVPATKCTPVSREKGKRTVIPRPAVFFLSPRAAPLRVGPVPKVVCRSQPATPPSSPFLQGTASPCSHLAATLHSLRSLRALGHWETLSRASAHPASKRRTTTPASPTRLRDSQQPRPTRKLPLPPQCVIHRHLPPKGEERGINIYNRRQRHSPLQVV